MTERERLIELLNKSCDERLIEMIDKALDKHESTIENYVHPEQEWIADYLLSNGVVVLPCSVNDTLYIADEKANIIRVEKVRTFFIGHPAYKENMPRLKMIRTDCHDIPIDDFGKTVFLTREEAEKALKERVNND